LKFLSETDKSQIIYEYNFRPELGLWRDFHDRNMGVLIRYDAAQYAYFHETSATKRKRILDLLSNGTRSD
jgi:hypothetical protein